MSQRTIYARKNGTKKRKPADRHFCDAHPHRSTSSSARSTSATLPTTPCAPAAGGLLADRLDARGDGRIAEGAGFVFEQAPPETSWRWLGSFSGLFFEEGEGVGVSLSFELASGNISFIFARRPSSPPALQALTRLGPFLAASSRSFDYCPRARIAPAGISHRGAAAVTCRNSSVASWLSTHSGISVPQYFGVHPSCGENSRRSSRALCQR